MSVTGPNTGFKIVNADGGPYTQDLGERYVSKEYLLDVYPNLVPGRTTPGLWAWGRNADGNLGDGTIVSKSSPIQIGLLTNWKQVSASGIGPNSLGGSLAIKTDGTMWAWGTNFLGNLGDGTIVHRSSPVQIGALTNWKQVDAGGYFTAAVKTDGTMWAWGNNNYNTGAGILAGMLGNGTIIHRSSPVQIGSLTNWKQVAAGSAHSLAVKTDGTLWAWGANIGIITVSGAGALGDGTIVSKSSPVQIGSLTNWKQVAASRGHSVAVKTDGTLWTWGGNIYGQLGDGTRTHRSSPVQVGSLTNWKYVDTGIGHCAAIKTDGTLWTWGDNTVGGLGDQTVTDKSSPIQIGTLTNWKEISAGLSSTSAIKTDGTLWVWGRNDDGQIGDGTFVSKSSPVQIGSLTSWKQTSSRQYVVLSILDGYI